MDTNPKPTNDFVFGTLATEDLRREHVRVRRAGVTHAQARRPIDPRPDQPIHLELTVGPEHPCEQAWLYWTSDGCDPEGALGQSAVGHATPLELVETTWDTWLWGYVRRYAVTLPGLPAGSVLRYRMSAQAGSAEVFADEGTYYACYISAESTPLWTQRAVIYQVFVDRFFPGVYGAWNHPDSLSGFYGGTLRGIGDKLDYLSNLGVNTLWLTPIFPSPTHHGYDATDLFEIEPRLGTKADLRHLIQGANAHGIRILLDIVPNHLSNQHPSFQAAVNDPASPYRNWYTFKHWPDQYASFFDVKELPQLNLRNPAARQHMLDAVKYWLDFGVDGFRVDYALGPTPDFWADFRRVCSSTQPDAWTFGEVVEPSETQLTFKGGLDGCLDFILLEGLRNTFAFGHWTAARFADFLRRHEDFFPASFSRLSFLDNHDMNRFLWAASGDKRRLKLAALAQFSLSGQPVIYYGTEVGLSQQRDTRYPDGSGIPEESRLPMIWDEEKQDHDLFALYKQLTGFRRGKDASLRTGRRKILHADAATLAYRRDQDGPSITTVLNISPEPQKLQLSGDWTDVLVATDSTSTADFRSGQVEINLPPLSGLYIR